MNWNLHLHWAKVYNLRLHWAEVYNKLKFTLTLSWSLQYKRLQLAVSEMARWLSIVCLQHPAILTPCGTAAGDRICTTPCQWQLDRMDTCTTPVNENWIMEFHVCHDRSSNHRISSTGSKFYLGVISLVQFSSKSKPLYIYIHQYPSLDRY